MIKMEKGITMTKCRLQYIDLGKAIIKSGDNSFEKIEIDPEEFKVLIFTSGTTSKATGVMICNKNLAQ